ncbi:MAG: S-adenosylmethionine:tRNA ribosyltransferase-isomerase [Planctomycetota bacterium]
MLSPARHPRTDRDAERLLRIDPSTGAFHDSRVRDLPSFLRPRDLVVVNDAATLPASLNSTSHPVELRLCGAPSADSWEAIAFGAGDWRARTEDRPAPPLLPAGTHLDFGAELHAIVTAVDAVSPRLVHLRFDEPPDAFWPALYRAGRPVQYSYLDRPLALWDVQTGWAARPWAAEAPSAGRPLSWATLLGLARAGVRVASITHSAGLSSSGDAALDARLPFGESFEIPQATVDAIAVARRVIAVGTSVVRALEGSACSHDGEIRAGAGRTTHLVTPDTRPRVVHGIFTGIHEPGTSHYRLLCAFAAEELLRESYRHAESEGYLCHEFGDSCVILGG